MNQDDINPQDDFLCWPPSEHPRQAPRGNVENEVEMNAEEEAQGDAWDCSPPPASSSKKSALDSKGADHDALLAPSKSAAAPRENGDHVADIDVGVEVDAIMSDDGFASRIDPGSDWMGSAAGDLASSALLDDSPIAERADQVEKTAALAQAGSAFNENDSTALDAPRKRAYGGARAATPPTPTLLPLAHKPDLFPAFMSRSALFSALRSNTGGHHNGPLPAQGDVILEFEGPRLSMADKRVWEALVRLAKQEEIDAGNPFAAPMVAVAEMAGFKKSQTRSAWAAIERLAASEVRAVVYGVHVRGKLLDSAVKRGVRRVVRFDLPFMEAALGKTMNAAVAGSLPGGAAPLLAQWLGDFFMTHEPSNLQLRLKYLRVLCGHPGAPKHFVACLEAAMSALAASRPDLIAGWSIDQTNRSSDKWALQVARGDARPEVKHPGKPHAGKAPTPAQLAAAAAAARRRGPSL